jgi:sugar phosphate permease
LLATLAACAALVFLNRSGIAFLFPSIQPQLELTNAQQGQLMAATSLAWAVSSVAVSMASDMLGIRPRF